MNPLKLIEIKEFFPYFIIGALATLIDWGVFSLAVTYFNCGYPKALILSFLTAGCVHYSSNKLITFQCRSKKIGSQLVIYIMVNATSLLLSLSIMALFIKLFAIQQILARMMTTLIMLVPNYLLHKNLSFSKKIFIQPEVN